MERKLFSKLFITTLVVGLLAFGVSARSDGRGLKHSMHHSTPMFDFQMEDMRQMHHPMMSTFDFETHRDNNKVRFDFERNDRMEVAHEMRHMHHM